MAFKERYSRIMSNYEFSPNEIASAINDICDKRGIDGEYRQLLYEFTHTFQEMYGDTIPTGMVIDKIQKINTIETFADHGQEHAGMFYPNYAKDMNNRTMDEFEHPFKVEISDKYSGDDKRAIFYHEMVHLISAQASNHILSQGFITENVGLEMGKTSMINEVMTEFYCNEMLRYENIKIKQGDFTYVIDPSNTEILHTKYEGFGYGTINGLGPLLNSRFENELLQDMFLGTQNTKDAMMEKNISPFEFEKEVKAAFDTAKTINEGNLTPDQKIESLKILEKPYETISSMDFVELHDRYSSGMGKNNFNFYLRDTLDIQHELPYIETFSRKEHDTISNINIQSADIEIAMKNFMPELHEKRMKSGMTVFDRDQETMDFTTVMSVLRDSKSEADYRKSQGEQVPSFKEVSYWHVPGMDTPDERCLALKINDEYRILYANRIDNCENTLKINCHDNTKFTSVSEYLRDSEGLDSIVIDALKKHIPQGSNAVFADEFKTKDSEFAHPVVIMDDKFYKLNVDKDKLEPLKLTEGHGFFGQEVASDKLSTMEKISNWASTLKEDPSKIVRNDSEVFFDSLQRQGKEMFYDLTKDKFEKGYADKQLIYGVLFDESHQLERNAIINGAKADLHFINGETLLQRTMNEGRFRDACVLIEHGADATRVDLNRLDNNGMGLIHHAATMGNHDVVDRLYMAGADLNLLDKEGKTALHIACSNFDVETSAKLIVTNEILPAYVNEATTTDNIYFIEKLNTRVFQLSKTADLDIASQKTADLDIVSKGKDNDKSKEVAATADLDM